MDDASCLTFNYQTQASFVVTLAVAQVADIIVNAVRNMTKYVLYHRASAIAASTNKFQILELNVPQLKGYQGFVILELSTSAAGAVASFDGIQLSPGSCNPLGS